MKGRYYTPDLQETFTAHPLHSESIDFDAAYKEWPINKLYGFNGDPVRPGDYVRVKRYMWATRYGEKSHFCLSRGDMVVLVKFAAVPRRSQIAFRFILPNAKVAQCLRPFSSKHPEYFSVKEILTNLNWMFEKVVV